MKKYEFTDETIERFGVTLHRIRACKDFTLITGTEIKAGKLGGFIEKESNLSQDENAWVSGKAVVSGNAWVSENTEVSGNAVVSENAWVSGNAVVRGNDEVLKPNHIVVIGQIGSRDDYTTFCRNKDGGINVKCGCFNGNIEEFSKKVSETHKGNIHEQVYKLSAEIAKLQILRDDE